MIFLKQTVRTNLERYFLFSFLFYLFIFFFFFFFLFESFLFLWRSTSTCPRKLRFTYSYSFSFSFSFLFFFSLFPLFLFLFFYLLTIIFVGTLASYGPQYLRSLALFRDCLDFRSMSESDFSFFISSPLSLSLIYFTYYFCRDPRFLWCFPFMFSCTFS